MSSFFYLTWLILPWQIHGIRNGSSVDQSFQNANIAESLLTDLASFPLKEKEVYLFYDKEVEMDIYLGRCLRHISLTASAITLLKLEEFWNIPFQKGQLRGKRQIFILLFKSPLREFLDELSYSSSWNPSHLIMISLEANGTRNEIIGHPVIQRSEFIVLFEMEKRLGWKRRFNMFNSHPFRANGTKYPAGVWLEHQVMSFNDLFKDRYPNFEGSRLYLASWCDDFPLIYLVNDACVGCNLDVLKVIGEKLNFTFTVEKESADGNWGSLEEGVWTGMLGDLAYNGRHLVINYFLVNHERWKDFDSTYPYHAEGFGFMARKPLPLPQWRNIIYPFTSWMWTAIFICTATVAFVFSVWLSLVSGEEKDLIKNIMKVGAGVLRQSVSVGWSGAWQRVWLASWWAGCIILSTAYTGNLIAFLTVPAYPSRVETVAQLASDALRVTMQDYGEFVPEALKESSDANLYTIGHKLDLFVVEDSLNYQPGVDMVTERSHVLLETYAYLMNLQMLYNVTGQTYLMKEQIYSGHLAWFLPKNTPYTSKISSALTRLNEVGIVEMFFKKHFRTVSASAPDSQQKFVPSGLGIEQVQGTFLLIIFGYSISTLVFIKEIASKGCCKSD